MRPARDMGSAFGITWDPSSWAVRFAIATAACTIALMVAQFLPDTAGLLLAQLLLFVPEQVLHLRIWQVATYAFTATPSLWNLLMCVYAVWAFGLEVERRLGPRTFIAYFFGLGLAGSLVTLGLSLPFHSLRQMVFFGSGAVSTGLVVVWARLHRGANVYFFFFPLRSEILVLLTLGLLGLSALEAGPHGWPMLLPDFVAFFAAELSMRAGFDLSPRRLYLRWRAWRIEQHLRKRAKNFTVISGGDDHDREDDDAKPKNGYLN